MGVTGLGIFLVVYYLIFHVIKGPVRSCHEPCSWRGYKTNLFVSCCSVCIQGPKDDDSSSSDDEKESDVD